MFRRKKILKNCTN